MPLSREQFARAEALYFEANDLPAERWQTFLVERCSDDDAVRNEVGALLGLRQSSKVIRPLELAVSEALGGTLAKTFGGTRRPGTDPAASYVGRKVGSYEIEEPIGRGGMGLVFRAQQLQPVRRTVALKLIRAGMDSPDVVARFESERQALALMNHPNVARVFDAGTADDGRHYFVMEYVASARPITTWCDAHRATIDQRLRLFIDVCDAVHHAHQRGVIHRDLKPSNILVSEVDGKPIAKVIDFGVAKAVGRPLADQSPVTHVGQLIGTPQYMSPEQADLRLQDVDTRSDVYALGVILYELLTGSTPLSLESLQDKGLDQVLRAVRDDDAPLPTARVATAPNLNELASRRQSDPTRLSRQLRGELEWVACKALEKDRSRRYPSAAALAEDLRRTLADEPVSAGPPSTFYRLRKLVRRHRVTVVAACVLALVIVAGTVATTWQAIRATRAEREARQRYNDIRKLADAVLFDLDETLRTQGPTRTRQAVVLTALRYLDGLSTDAQRDLTLRHDLARGYRRVGNIQYSLDMLGGNGSLGDVAGAIASYRKAIELGRSVVAEAPTSKSRNEVAFCLLFLGDAQRAAEDYTAAMASYDEARSILTSVLAADPNDPFSARYLPMVLDHCGSLWKAQNNRKAATQAYTESLKYRQARAAKMPNDALARLEVVQSQQLLAEFEDQSATHEMEAAHMEAMLPMVRQSLASDPDNPRRQRDLALGLARLAEHRLEKGQYADAVPLIQEAIGLEERLLQRDPENTIVQEDFAQALATLATAKEKLGDMAASIETRQRCVAICRQLLAVQAAGAAERRLAVSLVPLAAALRNTGKHAEAIAAAKEAVELFEKRTAATRDDASRASLADALNLLAGTYDAAGQAHDAEATRQRRQNLIAAEK